MLGLLTAVLDIDEVIAVIRSSDDAATARERLMGVFDLDRLQTDYILDLQLRRLTRLARIELESERDELTAQIAALDDLLADPSKLRTVVSDELAAVAEEFGTPRRTVLIGGAAAAAAAPRSRGAATLEVADVACRVLLSATGLLARTDGLEPLGMGGRRARHDAIAGVVRATTRGQVGLVTSFGRVHRLGVVDLPAMPPTATAPSLVGGVAVAEMTALEAGERPLCLLAFDDDDGPVSTGLWLATAGGVVKRVVPEKLGGRDVLDLVALRDGDRVVAAAPSDPDDEQAEVVLVTTDAQLLRFAVGAVRAQGRGAAGMAGIRLAPGAAVLAGTLLGPAAAAAAALLTVAGPAPARRRGAPTPWTGPAAVTGSVKITPLAEYPAKGRATGGVRCHRLGAGEQLLLAGVGVPPLRTVSASGAPVAVPDAAAGRRDGGGVALTTGIAAVAGELAEPPG